MLNWKREGGKVDEENTVVEDREKVSVGVLGPQEMLSEEINIESEKE